MTALKNPAKVRSLFDKKIEEKPAVDDPRDLYLPHEAAAALKVCRKTMERVAARNKLTRIELSGTSIYYYLKSEVHSLLVPEKRR